MTEAQQEDLLIEWGLYEPSVQQWIIDEYNFLTIKEDCIYNNFRTFSEENLRFRDIGRQPGWLDSLSHFCPAA